MKQFIRVCVFVVLSVMSTVSARAQWVLTNGQPNGGNGYGLEVIGTNLFVSGPGGVGLYRSTDNGTSWTADTVGMGANVTVYTLAVSGTNLFAGTSRGLTSVVLFSNDNGTSWKAAASKGLPAIDIVDCFAVIGTNLFAGIYIEGKIYGDGVYLSTDNGTSWRADTAGMGADARNQGLVVIGTNLFAGTYGNGVYLSTDSGTSWTAANTGLTNLYVSFLVVNGTNLFAFAGTNGDVFRSTDNGTSWTADTALPHFTSFVSIGTNLFAGTYGNGVYRSTDNGRSWIAASTGLPANASVRLGVIGTNLFAGTNGLGLWRRPLSDFGISDVSQITPIQNSIQSYPNPFSQSTTISFTPKTIGYADVSIVNLLGVEIARKFSGELTAGEHTFTWNPAGLPDGMYECLIRMNGRVEKLPMLLMR